LHLKQSLFEADQEIPDLHQLRHKLIFEADKISPAYISYDIDTNPADFKSVGSIINTLQYPQAAD
jgi:hypothetical protein